MLSWKHNDSQSLGNYNDKAKRETVARVKAVNGQQNDQKVAHLVPKKSKEKDYTDMDIELIINDINNTPRKSGVNQQTSPKFHEIFKKPLF